MTSSAYRISKVCLRTSHLTSALRSKHSRTPVLGAVCSLRKYSTETIPAPNVSGEEKQFSPKLQKIVDDISKLTLIEVADLNELLKKTLNISDAPMMAMGAMPASGPSQSQEDEEDAADAKPVQSLFTVKLVKIDDKKKVAIIKEIKGLIEGMNLVQAKKFVESLPQTVKADMSKEDAEKLKETLTGAGATVEIQ